CRGVRAVVTGAEARDLAGPLPHGFDPAAAGGRTAVLPMLAVDEVRFVGDPVAVVVADTAAGAEAALAAIRVDYEVLPAVVELEQAMGESAPRVFGHWEDNVLMRVPYSVGDAEGALARSPHVLKDGFRIQRYHAAPLERRGYLADWAAGGKLTMHASTQNPHLLRTNLARIFELTEDRIRVVATRLGGGFGHKLGGYPEEALVCLVSRLVGAPVKWVESREESLLFGAREFAVELAVGFDDTGRILALKGEVVGNVGCLSVLGGWAMIFHAGLVFPGPYRVPDCAIDSVAVVTHKGPWNGARGYGKEAATLALERMVDLIAVRLALDPVQVRMRNFVPPDAFPYWSMAKHLDSGDYPGALAKAVHLGGYDRRRDRQREVRAEGRLRGVGVAFELTPEGDDIAGSLVRGYDTSTVRVSPLGGVTVLTGVTTPGTGNDTSIAALVAHELGLRADAVSVVQGDTDACPHGFGNFGSRSLTAGGGAAVQAARKVRARMADAAAVLLGVPADALAFSGGHIASGARQIGFAEVADQVYRNAYAIPGLDDPLLEATMVYRPLNSHHIPDEQGRTSGQTNYPYSAHMCVVEVDPETGRVELLEYTAVDDCGVQISPLFVAGQLYGAIVMGVGGALFEQLPYDTDGRPLAGTFKHYLVPRATDVPDITLEHQTTPSPYTLLGTKGAGESGVGGAVACVANAVNDALRPLGARVHEMPLSPPRVLAAIRSAGAA
ncbi:MAG: xanthine dehydrogenase family protein molybdopterin-binding subunit, partial [Pseudonocardia sp.]